METDPDNFYINNITMYAGPWALQLTVSDICI